MSLNKLSREAVIERLKSVELLSLDTDGVLTDGGIYFSDEGEQLRRFNVKDGMGIKLIQSIGVEIIIISSSTTLAIKHRASALGIDKVYLGVEDKKSKIKEYHLEDCFHLIGSFPLEKIRKTAFGSDARRITPGNCSGSYMQRGNCLATSSRSICPPKSTDATIF